MIASLLLALLLVQAYRAENTFEGHKVEDVGTCKPECGPGECCVSVPITMVSKKRAAAGRASASGDLVGPYPMYYSHYCRPLKQSGEKCLLNNAQSEWCDCVEGLKCTKSDALNNFYGTCQ